MVLDPNSRGHAKTWKSLTSTQEATPKLGTPSPQLEAPSQSLGVHQPNSRGHAKAWESILPHSRKHAEEWESITLTQGAATSRGSPSTRDATEKRGSPSPKSRRHTKALESITPAVEATPKGGTPSPHVIPSPGATPKQEIWPPHLERERHSLADHDPNGRGHRTVWEAINPTSAVRTKAGVHHPDLRGHTGSPPRQLKRPCCSLGVSHGMSRHLRDAWESIIPTLETTPKRRSPSTQLKGPRQNSRVRHPKPRGYANAWESTNQTLEPTPKRGIPSPKL